MWFISKTEFHTPMWFNQLSINHFKTHKSIKQILVNFSKNVYHFNSQTSQTSQTRPKSLVDYMKDMVVRLMIKADDMPAGKGRKDDKFVVSSGDENDAITNDNEYLFKQIVDEYCCSNESNSKLATSIINAMSIKDKNQYRRFATIFRKLEIQYLNRAKKYKEGSKKWKENYARSLFAKVAQMSLRSGNSSSELERAFSDSLRCCESRKSKKRNVFT